MSFTGCNGRVGFGKEAYALGALVVHYSTDYVFDGALAKPYVESDATDPHGVYDQIRLATNGNLALVDPALKDGACRAFGQNGREGK